MYGKRIRELREENNLTQKQLAELLHTTATTISKYEREALQPNIELIILLCKTLNTSADYLLGITDL
ncbi:MAG: helix-turn-helix transcriptional regulator [Clostridia bacterium]|nr:helix-turn-helix transcriptional regulator [Clostridia bacterium]